MTVSVVHTLRSDVPTDDELAEVWDRLAARPDLDRVTRPFLD
ncbi:hypothetical protein AIIKEEIJ_02272 [Rhodococcus sp. YH1]|nr:hypothetical protein [Rhodococcus sp. YH1]